MGLFIAIIITLIIGVVFGMIIMSCLSTAKICDLEAEIIYLKNILEVKDNG